MPAPDDLTDSETVSAESFVVQAMGELPDAVKSYATGDRNAFNVLQERAVQLAAGQVKEDKIASALASKFGDGI